MPDLFIRYATQADVDTITTHRIAMFTDMGNDGNEMTLIRPSYTRWLARQLDKGDYIGALVCDGDAVVAGGGLWLMHDYPPYIGSLSADRGMIFNMYTSPHYRRRGIARWIVQDLMAIAQEREITVVTLHASDEGRPLYAQFGFQQTNEMRWRAE